MEKKGYPEVREKNSLEKGARGSGRDFIVEVEGPDEFAGWWRQASGEESPHIR